MSLPLSVAIVSMMFVAAGAQALGDDHKARTSSTTSFDAHLVNTTPPDEVGQGVDVKLDGKIMTPHHKPQSSCRVGRTVHIITFGLHGEGVGDTYPSNRKGHFSSEWGLSYGSDVSESGGTLTVKISTKKSHVPGKRLGESYTCKKLTETLTVDYAPALSG